MNRFILHHYALSPYSEKIRCMLSYAGLDWQSVVHKEMPPRPVLEKLAGGYGRIPVAQIGADIYCDSNLIAEEISKLAGKPELSLKNSSDEIKKFVSHVEGKIFFAGVMTGSTARLRKKARQSMGLIDLLRFAIDRFNMARKATSEDMIKPGEAKEIISAHLDDMETRLKEDFLFGDKPCIADFAAYHTLWFMRDLGGCSFMADYPKVCAWMDKLAASGSSNVEKIKKSDAMDVASSSEPQFFTDKLSGKDEVAIKPADYRQISTEGKLVFEDENSWVVSRKEKDLGWLNVHFPKYNYVMVRF